MEINYSNFIIEFSITSGVLYAFYLIFLRKSALFNWNRIFLILSPIISLLLPFINNIIPTGFSETSPLFEQKFLINAQTFIANIQENANQISTNKISITQSLLLIYLVTTGYFIFKFLRELYLIQKLKNNCLLKDDNGYRIYNTNDSTNFSFINSIFICNKNLSNSEINQIIAHEKVHINQKHSIDLIYFELGRIYDDM